MVKLIIPSDCEDIVSKQGTTLPKEKTESKEDSNEIEVSWYDLSQSVMTNPNDSQGDSSDPTQNSKGEERKKKSDSSKYLRLSKEISCQLNKTIMTSLNH